jgi:hypothetical protein
VEGIVSLFGHVFTAPDGVRGFDTAEIVAPKAAAAMRGHGYRFCVRYVRRDKPHASALSASEAKSLLGNGIGLMLVQYVESETSWNPTATKGTTNGRIAGAEAAKLGVPWGVTVWCDLEGVASRTASSKVIDYCNNWHLAVASAGYVPGLYVGYHAGLNATQLYRALRFSHYWSAYNLNTDQAPAVRGVQMRQAQRKQRDSVPSAGFDFQVDTIRADALGGRPTLLALEGWPELP